MDCASLSTCLNYLGDHGFNNCKVPCDQAVLPETNGIIIRVTALMVEGILEMAVVMKATGIVSGTSLILSISLVMGSVF